MTTYASVRVPITASGPQNIQIPFPYLEKDHIQVYLNSRYLLPEEIEWDSSGLLRLTAEA